MSTRPTMVVNPSEVEGIIFRINNEPLDPAVITRFWKVFSTIKRCPFDPTAQARRLENFWWRVWGSRQNKLSGRVLASLFHQLTNDHLLSVPYQQRHAQTATTDGDSIPFAHQSTITTVPSSKPKTAAPVPHPILKKSKDPPLSAPRPTARFISPHDSEEKKRSNRETHASRPSSSLGSQGSRSDKKRAVAPPISKKKPPVVVAAKKKRPVILSQQGSQSSIETAGNFVEPARMPNGFLLPASESRASVSTLQESGRSNRQISEKLSANKIPSVRRTSTSKLRSSSSTSGRSIARRALASNTARATDRAISQSAEKDVTAQRRLEKGKQVDRDVMTIQPDLPPVLTRKSSPKNKDETHSNHGRSKLIFKGNMPSRNTHSSHIPLAGATSLVSCYIAVPGKIYSQASTSSSLMTNHGDTTHKSDADKTQNKTFPSPSSTLIKGVGQQTQRTLPNVPDELSRSKSQLTLLLEKDRARNRQASFNGS